MTTLVDKPPTGEQIERIRQLSQVSLGSHGAAFEKYGYPSTRGQASEILKRLDRERRSGDEDEGHQEEPMTQPPAFNPPAEELVLDKICSKCGQAKALDEFHRNKTREDGYAGECKDCVNKRSRRKRAKGGSDPTRRSRPPRPPSAEGDIAPKADPVSSENRSKVNRSVGARPPVDDERGHFAMAGDPDPDPPLSEVDEAWRQVFANPTLAQLEALQAFLDVASLDEAARITRLIGALVGAPFAPKDSP